MAQEEAKLYMGTRDYQNKKGNAQTREETEIGTGTGDKNNYIVEREREKDTENINERT